MVCLAVLLAMQLQKECPFPHWMIGQNTTSLNSTSLMSSPTWGNSIWLCDENPPFCLHMLSLEYDKADKADAQSSILLIPGTSHHAGVYDTFAPKLMKQAKSNVFALDLKGKYIQVHDVLRNLIRLIILSSTSFFYSKRSSLYCHLLF